MGTGASAGQLKHPLGGKTGTTNDFTDAWFIGFSPSVTCGTWMGYDNRQSLGEKETGAKAALPMWMDFMRAAIAKKPNEAFPEGNQPKKELDVPVTPPGSAAGQASPKPTDGADPDAAEPEAAPAPAAPRAAPIERREPPAVAAPPQ
jgi:penicillin-binding protein 1A